MDREAGLTYKQIAIKRNLASKDAARGIYCRVKAKLVKGYFANASQNSK